MSPRSKKQFEEMRQSKEDLILSASLKLFSSKGFGETSIRDIAKEAGISVGLLYNYYKSKEDLAMAVMKSSFQKIQGIFESDSEASPEKKLESSISNFLYLIEHQLDKIRLLAQMGIHKEKLKMLNEITISKYENSVKNFEDLLKATNYPNAKTEARFLVAALDGIAFEHILMDTPFSLKDIRNSLINKYCSND